MCCRKSGVAEERRLTWSMSMEMESPLHEKTEYELQRDCNVARVQQALQPAAKLKAEM